MSITIESTTDSAEVVSSLMQPPAEVPSGADSSAESQSETAGESGAPEDETAESEDSSTEESSDEEKPAKKGKGGFQRRIDRLTTERNLALQRLEALERNLA